MKYSAIHTTKSFLTIVAALVIAVSVAAPLRAQSFVSPDGAPVRESPSVGVQHATLLRSRFESIRVIAMQNVIVLAAQQSGEVDLTPTVPALLDIYEHDRNEQHQIMAVAALGTIGNRYGMNALYRLSERLRYSPHHSLRTYRFAQNAVMHYYVAQMKERAMEQPAYYAAKGSAK